MSVSERLLKDIAHSYEGFSGFQAPSWADIPTYNAVGMVTNLPIDPETGLPTEHPTDPTDNAMSVLEKRGEDTDDAGHLGSTGPSGWEAAVAHATDAANWCSGMQGLGAEESYEAHAQTLLAKAKPSPEGLASAIRMHQIAAELHELLAEQNADDHHTKAGAAHRMAERALSSADLRGSMVALDKQEPDDKLDRDYISYTSDAVPFVASGDIAGYGHPPRGGTLRGTRNQQTEEEDEDQVQNDDDEEEDDDQPSNIKRQIDRLRAQLEEEQEETGGDILDAGSGAGSDRDLLSPMSQNQAQGAQGAQGAPFAAYHNQGHQTQNQVPDPQAPYYQPLVPPSLFAPTPKEGFDPNLLLPPACLNSSPGARKVVRNRELEYRAEVEAELGAQMGGAGLLPPACVPLPR